MALIHATIITTQTHILVTETENFIYGDEKYHVFLFTVVYIHIFALNLQVFYRNLAIPLC